jgi:hypothetical protein
MIRVLRRCLVGVKMLSLPDNYLRVPLHHVKSHCDFVLMTNVMNMKNDHLLVKVMHFVHVMYVHLYFVRMTKMGGRVKILLGRHLHVKRVHEMQMRHVEKNRRSD